MADVRVHAQGDKLLAVVIHELLAASTDEPRVTRYTLERKQQSQTGCDGFHVVAAAM